MGPLLPPWLKRPGNMGGRSLRWRSRGRSFCWGGENGLRSRTRDENALKDEQIKKLNQKIADLVLDNDILWEALKPDPKPEE